MSEVVRRGTYSVEVCKEFLLPGSAGRIIPLRVYAPCATGRFPVLIFSHGAGASKDAYTRITRYWSSHGYVCIQPSHEDAISPRSGLTESRLSLSEVFERLKTDWVGWRRRIQDITDIIDSLPQLEDSLPVLSGRMESQRIGLAGHSYGAFTTLMLGGARVNRGEDGPVSWPDPRIKALVALSASGTTKGRYGFDAASFEKIDLPLLVVTGSKDVGLSNQPAVWRTEPYTLAPPGDKSLAYFEGGSHISFTGSSLRGWLGASHLAHVDPQLRQWLAGGDVDDNNATILEGVRSITLWFWNRYLKGECLEPPALGGAVRFESK